MADFDREERAFRTAMTTHVVEAPTDPLEVGTRRRPWWLVGLAAAVAVTAVVLVVPTLSGDRADDPVPPGGPKPTNVDEGWDWRWVSYRDVEVKAPANWHFDYETLRPDCIKDAQRPRDPWARDVPPAPYVMVGVPWRSSPAIGCFRKPEPGDPDPAFGQLPFALWQPFVKLDEARPDLDEYPDRKDGQWEYRDWTLTRTTVGPVQITVLAPPTDSSLGDRVVASARQVETTSLGCDPGSPVQGVRFARPNGSPVPRADEVAAVAVCEYARTDGIVGLEGSRRITGDAAQDLVRAIHDAPSGGGPDEPEHCVDDMYGDRAIALRFFATEDEVAAPLAEAYVYYHWCFGNGIVDSQGTRQLTPENCAPLFANPPISLWSGQHSIVEACGPLGR